LGSDGQMLVVLTKISILDQNSICDNFDVSRKFHN
jgi:hypothetical protein